MSTTPASFPQIGKFYADALGSPSNDRTQLLLSNGDLFKTLADAADHLKDVDRAAFRALLAPQPKVINWTPVSQYADKLRDWNGRFGLGLTEAEITGLLLPDHAGPHQPTSISKTFGKGPKGDRAVIQQIIAYEMAKIGCPYTDYIEEHQWSVAYHPGSEPDRFTSSQLAPALLDIGRFWDPDNGVTIPGVRRELVGQWLPSLEVDWLMAFNPQVLAAIDGKVIPGFIAPGLVVGSADAPGFVRVGDEACANLYWDDDPWYDYSVVVFREC